MIAPTRSSQRTDNGAVLVEFVIYFPLFLLVVLFSIWLGVMMNLQSSFSTSITNGIRLAETRSSRRLIGKDLVADVSLWGSSQPGAPSDATVAKYFQSPEGDASIDFQGFYNNAVAQIFPSVSTFKEMPPLYHYVILYLTESMKRSIGQTVRMPCNAYDPDLGIGCVSCLFMNPDTASVWQPGHEPNYPSEPGQFLQWTGTGAPPTDRIGVECAYRPNNSLIGPITNLIRMMGGGQSREPFLIIRRRYFVNEKWLFKDFDPRGDVRW